MKLQAFVLIVPLWNWNGILIVSLLSLISSSNRTFMELKFLFMLFVTSAKLRSNRTFMELKWEERHITFELMRVLIVPLWNWNYIIIFLLSSLLCSNRTFMELKSNRAGREARDWRSSNRTFMELKYRGGGFLFLAPKVLIVPLWNWNVQDERAETPR